METNVLYYGDNLDILRHHGPDLIFLLDTRERRRRLQNADVT